MTAAFCQVAVKVRRHPIHPAAPELRSTKQAPWAWTILAHRPLASTRVGAPIRTWVVARTTHTATHAQTFRGIPPTGKRFTYRTIDVWRVENGKFAEHWDITDAEEVLRQLHSE